MKRAIVLILDGVGIGELPDAGLYNDGGSNTLANLARAVGGLKVPVLENLGLGNIADLAGVKKTAVPRAHYGKMAERSPGKDSTSGHWELMGVILERAFPTYPHGFPADLIAEFEAKIGRRVIGNIPASGTEIIKDMGEEHIRTKSPIVYTSADSVFQIACHVDVFALNELYRFCEIARAMLTGCHSVARVIARPFAGTAPEFFRTKDRRDFSLPPPGLTLLDRAKNKGYEVIAIGKVDNMFADRGYTRSYHSVNNMECVDFVLQAMASANNTFIVANFVQFDMDWGHRNDVRAFARGLAEIDTAIGRVINTMNRGDALFITADHGNDPTTPSTDHSREYVPILVYPPSALPVGKEKRNNGTGKDLGVRKTFADLAKTIAGYLDIEGVENGEDFGKTV